MKPRHAIPFFLLALLALPAVASVLAHASTTSAPVTLLEYNPAGVIKPGYVYKFRLHALSLVAPSGPFIYAYAFADAGLDIDGSRVGIHGDDGVGLYQKVYVILPGEEKEVGKVYTPGQREFDATVTITTYCVNESAGGNTPPAGYFLIRIDYDGYGGSYTRWIVKKPGGSGNVGVPIEEFYEKASVPIAGTKQSWVAPEDGYPVKHEDCRSYLGPNPTPGDDTRNDNNNSQQQKGFIQKLTDIMNKIGMLGVGVVAVLGLLMVARR